MTTEQPRRRRRLTSLRIREVSLVDRPANPGARVALWKRDGGAPPQPQEDTMSDDEKSALEAAEATIADLTRTVSEQAEEIARLRKERDEAVAAADAARGETGDEPTDEIAKAMATLPAALRERFAATEKLARRLADEAEERDFVVKAAGFRHLPVKAEDFGPVLRRVVKGGATTADLAELDRVLVAADAAIGTARLTRSLGVPVHGTGDTAGGAEGVWGEICRKADALVAKGGDLSVEMARERIMELSPDLYRRYREEKRAAIAKRHAA